MLNKKIEWNIELLKMWYKSILLNSIVKGKRREDKTILRQSR
jgi:hypothetical protein